MSSILELFGGKTYAEMTDAELTEITQSRRRDITAIIEEDVQATAAKRVTIGKKTKASEASEDLL
jgi:hypothetical protein